MNNDCPILRELESQYDVLVKKREILTLQDFPRIHSVPIVPRKQRRKIYEKQNGFEFHGMKSQDLGSILVGFHGHTRWILPFCKSHNLTYEEFERMLDDCVSMSSTYGDIFLLREKSGEIGSECAKKDYLYGSFPITEMFLPSLQNFGRYSNRLDDVIKEKFIRPRLTIIETGSPSIYGLCGAYKRIERIKNQLWVYISWLQRG